MRGTPLFAFVFFRAIIGYLVQHSETVAVLASLSAAIFRFEHLAQIDFVIDHGIALEEFVEVFPFGLIHRAKSVFLGCLALGWADRCLPFRALDFFLKFWRRLDQDVDGFIGILQRIIGTFEGCFGKGTDDLRILGGIFLAANQSVSRRVEAEAPTR